MLAASRGLRPAADELRPTEGVLEYRRIGRTFWRAWSPSRQERELWRPRRACGVRTPRIRTAIVSERNTEITHWDGPGLDAWRAWTPAEAAQELAAVAIPWCVVGGWAADLFVGEQTRDHEDLEIAILREHFPQVRQALNALVFHVVGDGEVRRLQDEAEPSRDKHQNWGLDVAAEAWRVDVMLEPGDRETWVFRKDESIRAPRAFMVMRTTDGIPFLGPHGVLLYKAKSARTKDEADLSVCLPRMEENQRAWLATALETVHPGHPWLERIA
jgi:Aminoglycoside-2''-adenylyltransferase